MENPNNFAKRRGDEILADAFGAKSEQLAGQKEKMLDTRKVIADLTGRIDALQEIFGEETPNGVKSMAAGALRELMQTRSELASGKKFSDDDIKKIEARIASLETQLLPSEKISAN